MTLEELAEELGVKPNYLRKRFQDVKKKKKKIGIIIEKVGRAASAEYGIKTWYDSEIRYEHLDPDDFE